MAIDLQIDFEITAVARVPRAKIVYAARAHD
jgi:hypothetical protein